MPRSFRVPLFFRGLEPDLLECAGIARQFHFPEVQSLDTIEGLRAYQDLFRTVGSKADWYESPEVFDLARRCFAAFDGAPLLGLDVLFDEDEKPYFIEANPGGNTWHFSSNMTGRELRARGTFLEEQFDGFVLAGRTLARRALAEAL